MPWITLYVAILIPLLTFVYLNLPLNIRNNAALWITSPFNISYELGGNGLALNYALVVLIFLLVELYSRNIADLKGRASLIRNAGLLSIVSAYIASAIMWIATGSPSAGTSIIAFNVLVFFSFETYDSELITRMSEKRNARKTLEIVSLAFVVLVISVSAVLFIYLNRNTFWYVHILGAIIFAPIYYIYLSRHVKQIVDRTEERFERDVEKDWRNVEEKVERKR